MSRDAQSRTETRGPALCGNRSGATPVYGLLERLVLGLGMCWISVLASRAFMARRRYP